MGRVSIYTGRPCLSTPASRPVRFLTTRAPVISPHRARAAMALLSLSGDEQRILFDQLCNVLDPGVAVDFSSITNELWASTQALRQQLKADHEAAAALCHKVGMRSCKELREAKGVFGGRGLSTADLALLATLGSVLPALKVLDLSMGEQRLAEGLGAGALPNLRLLAIRQTHEGDVGDAGASALAAALGRGAMPRLKHLGLSNSAIGDAGLVALAPALRRRPALEHLDLTRNPLGDKGLIALVGPPLPPKGGLKKLKLLKLNYTQVSDAGCAALASAFDNGALPTLDEFCLHGIPASVEAIADVHEMYMLSPRFMRNGRFAGA